jgi:hypothetical protein
MEAQQTEEKGGGEGGKEGEAMESVAEAREEEGGKEGEKEVRSV